MKTKRKCPCCLGTGLKQDPESVGREMKERREAAGLKLSWVARRMGVSLSHLSYLEHGKRQWNPRLADLFLRALR